MSGPISNSTLLVPNSEPKIPTFTLFPKVRSELQPYKYRTSTDIADETLTKPHRQEQSEIGIYITAGVNPISVGLSASSKNGWVMSNYARPPSQLQAHAISGVNSMTSGPDAALYDTASLDFGFPWHSAPQLATSRSANETDATLSGVGELSSAAATNLTVTTDKADYAPGSTATFVAAGVDSGSSVEFRVADLPSDPGVNGIVDVYSPFSVTDGGIGDADGTANGVVVAQWQVPSDGRATGATLQLSATSGSQTATTTLADAANKIVLENQKPGTPQSIWAIGGDINNQGDPQIEGFATQISTNAGQTVSFKIDTASNGYTLDIYRLGYYGGDGARLVGTMHHSGSSNQPNPLFDSSTNTVDAGNWSVTDSWSIPSDVVSGVYFAKLTTDVGDFQNMIPFIVRNDGAPTDILFQTSDTTWQAYNPWGGYNLYTGPDRSRDDRAYAVSYNRPIAMNSTLNDFRPAGLCVWRGIPRNLLVGGEWL